MNSLSISVSWIVLSILLLLVTEGQASILMSPLRRQSIHRRAKALRITPTNGQNSIASPQSNGDDHHQLNNVYHIAGTAKRGSAEIESLREGDSSRAVNRENGVKSSPELVRKTTARSMDLKQQRREKVQQERQIDRFRQESDTQIKAPDDRSKSPWWSRGKEGLRWKRNRNTGIPEVVEGEDQDDYC